MYKAGMHKNQENKGKLIKEENFPTVKLIFQQIPPEDHLKTKKKTGKWQMERKKKKVDQTSRQYLC